MGKYINNIEGIPMGQMFSEKCRTLEYSGATKIDTPTKWKEGLVVVVDNGWMAAAAYAYDERELEAFLHPDPRPKQWYYFEQAKQFAK